ncbi:Hsp70-Hsp90 organizing protein 1 [Stylophora pistillata]|uniref:Hsp70-Hsp90 organizing protein 1 n=1 Tax=Stylophora pistillata TaxID=50429 RepID=A0A2B4S524_STYPI|nr:Hsp70-Hsp90 organizing protein 1 [Stylophora pistillata]
MFERAIGLMYLNFSLDIILENNANPATSVSSFDLDDKQKRWVVIGVTLNKLLLPVLRGFARKELAKHYTSLKSSSGIDKQVHPTHLKKDGSFDLNYGSINNNWGTFKRKVHRYDYKVKSAEDLAKLYLEPHMAKFTGFDSTCDLSAVLGMLANSSVFHPRIQTNAKDVRSKVRNEWGHCNFDLWNELDFNNSFQLMETLIRSLGLPTKADEDQVCDELQEWETKGLKLCMGSPVDKDLMKLVSIEVTNLTQNLEAIKKFNVDEAKRIGEALQDATDEITKFDKRITDIESRLEEEHQAQTEKNKDFSSTIEDISNNITRMEECQDTNEQNISLLEERHNGLESAVTSLKGGQGALTSQVEDLEFGQTQLDFRLKKLEEGSAIATVYAEILNLPSRNHCFCGRERELQKIAAQLKNVVSGCSESAICGLGGVGKTSLAVEFLWRQKEKEEYPGGTFWILGENNNLFQLSVSEMARQVGTFDDKDFSNSLSRTLDWLRKREQLWCLVVDNLDELEISMDMRKLLNGYWKQAGRGHIIITTRREARETGEETGIEETSCIELKCFTAEEGVQFLKSRSGTAGEDSDFRELVRELGGLPLALDQAAAYIRSLRQPIKEYLKKYRRLKMHLLKKKKARNLVENTTSERLAVHTTWLLNFNQVSQMSEEMDLGETPSIVMKICAYLGPDDIPYQIINEGLHVVGTSGAVSDLWDAAEIVSLLTKFSLFQRYGTDSVSVHRLVQDVIRSEIEKDKIELRVLCCAVHTLNHALTKTRSPAEVCKSFFEDAVFSVENPPSLQLWGKLASHSTYLQEHLRSYLEKHENDVESFYTDATVRIFNEAAIFFSVSQEKVKAQAMQKKKLELLVHLGKPTPEEDCDLPHYFVDVPLKDKDYKVITCCMRNPSPQNEVLAGEDSIHNERKEEADELREKGNDAFKNRRFKEALNLYTRAIDLSPDDHQLFCNRALSHLKLEDPRKALQDCKKCLYLKPDYSKALQRKAWALRELVESGNSELEGQKRAAVAVALHFDPSLRQDRTFCQMFPKVTVGRVTEIYNETQLAFALMTIQGNETLLLHEGEYHLSAFRTPSDLQVVGGEISCEDYPDCNGVPGCVAPSLGKPACDRTGKFGDSDSTSGISGFPGVVVSLESSGLIENCVIFNCGGGGALVVGQGSRLLVKNCEVYKNHQSGLEAREGGELEALGNKIFDNGNHGILIWKLAGKCDVNDNKIFENGKVGIIVGDTKEKITLQNNSIYHNRAFGISLDNDSQMFISNNKIFENGFWGIVANRRTSAHIVGNELTGNKCGGIFIGVNYSGRVLLEKNTVRDHSGPWLEYQFKVDSPNIDFSSLDGKDIDALGFLKLPEGEKRTYSKAPILKENKVLNNEEGMYHPREVAERSCSGCIYCRRRRDKVVSFVKCQGCHIASYCSKECQRNHRPKHKTICLALKTRYAVQVDRISSAHMPGFTCIPTRMFGSHLKGIGKGPEPKPNKEFIVKIQTRTLNSHPLQLMVLYDQSVTIDCYIVSPEIFNVIMDCGVLGALEKFTIKKCFFWAMFTEPGGKLTIYIDHLAPYQKW